MEFSRCTLADANQNEKAALRAVSQNSAACNVEVDIVLGELETRTAKSHRQLEQPPE